MTLRQPAQRAIQAQKFLDKQFNAATKRIEREAQQPWPAIPHVYDVTIRASYDGGIVIDVSDANFYVITRVRNKQDALAEIVGFWARAERGLIMEPSTPADVREYLDALDDVPVGVGHE